MKWLNTRFKQLAAFFTITYLLTWAAWIPVFSRPDTVPSQLSFIGLFAPAVCALVLTGLIKGRAGMINMLKQYFVWRLDVKWSLLAFFLIPAIFLFVALFVTKASLQHLWMGNSWLFITISFLFLMVINSGEEIGWRGFALPRLQSIFANPLMASIVLGLIWGAWHLPEYLDPAQSSFPFPVFLLFTTGLSIIYTILYNRSSGSLLVAVIFHVSTDIMPRILNMTVFTSSTWLWITGLTWVAALLLYWRTRSTALVIEQSLEGVELVQ